MMNQSRSSKMFAPTLHFLKQQLLLTTKYPQKFIFSFIKQFKYVAEESRVIGIGSGGSDAVGNRTGGGS
jgi:hypothetical protein